MTVSGVRRDLLRFFLPIAAIVAAFVVISSLFLSALFREQAGVILEARETERLDQAMRLFSRVQMGSLPAYINAIDDNPIRDYLYGREWSKERTLRALELLDRTLIGNDFIDSFYLYHESVGYLSTRSGYEGFDDVSDPGLPGFLAAIREHGLSRYVMRRITFQGDTRQRNLFTVVMGNLPPEGKGMRFAFVANLSERRIREALSADGVSFPTMYILDGNRRFLSHPDAELFGTSVLEDSRFLPLLERTERRGSMTVADRSGSRWIASWMDQPEMRWRFVTLTPEAEVFAPVLRVRNRIVLAVIIVLVAAVAVAFALSLSMSERERRTRLMLACLRGELEEGEAAAAILRKPFVPRFRCPCAAALIVAEGSHPDMFRLETLLREGFRRHSGPVEVIRDSDRTFVVLYPVSGSTAGDNLAEALDRIRPRAGAPVGGYRISRIPSGSTPAEAYRILRTAFRGEYLRQEGQIVEVSPETVKPDSGRGPAAPVDLGFGALEKAFRMDDSRDALHRLDTLAGVLKAARDPELYRYTVSVLARRIPELLGDEAESLLPGGVESFRTALSAADRLGDAMTILRAAAQRLHERGGLHSERRRLELIQRVKGLVEAGLGDRTMGTATIAAEVGLSPSYLRDLFKRSEGTALLEYIGSRRLESAKQLLTSSRLSVREVCDRSGFISYSYFFTYFKKSTGLTPSEYRDKIPASL